MNEITYLSQPEVQYGWVWLPIILAVFLGGGVLGLLVEILSRLTGANENILRIAILGTKGAGKTTLWRFFTKQKLEEGTSHDEIRECTVKIGEKVYTLREGLDIGGGDSFVKSEYENLIKNKDFVIFIFNAKKILDNNTQEIMEVRARFIKIGQIMDNLPTENRGQYHIIASHLDHLKIKNEKDYKIKRGEIVDIIKDDYFKKLSQFNIDKNFILLNLTDEKAVKEYIESTFKK